MLFGICEISKGCIVLQESWSPKIYGLVQERRNSIANALELHLSCTNPWKYSVVQARFPNYSTIFHLIDFQTQESKFINRQETPETGGLTIFIHKTEFDLTH